MVSMHTPDEGRPGESASGAGGRERVGAEAPVKRWAGLLLEAALWSQREGGPGPKVPLYSGCAHRLDEATPVSGPRYP